MDKSGSCSCQTRAYHGYWRWLCSAESGMDGGIESSGPGSATGSKPSIGRRVGRGARHNSDLGRRYRGSKGPSWWVFQVGRSSCCEGYWSGNAKTAAAVFDSRHRGTTRGPRYDPSDLRGRRGERARRGLEVRGQRSEIRSQTTEGRRQRAGNLSFSIFGFSFLNPQSAIQNPQSLKSSYSN